MLSERDVPLYLVAIKSFLRHYAGVSVVVHSDGTLTHGSAALIRRHVPDCRIISAAEADDRARRVLGEGSFLFRWRSLDACYRRLVDTEIWHSSARKIIMDSDIIIYEYPCEIISWIESAGAPLLMGQPPSLEPPAPGSFAARYVGTILKEKLAQMGEALGDKPRYLDGTTGGFYGCSNELSLERIKMVLDVATRLGIPMTQWGGDQTAVVYLLSTAGASRLDPERYFNFFADQSHKVSKARLIHFIGTDRFYKNIYLRCALRVIDDLCQTTKPLAI